MYIYSGECRLGICGEPTPFKDLTGADLFVGDIVLPSSIDASGICDNHELTAVVSDKFKSYSDGTHVEKEGQIEYFVMGIKGVDFMGRDSECWSVRKLKSFDQVVEGEVWKDYGFKYSNQ
jgi:hypothetical protein